MPSRAQRERSDRRRALHLLAGAPEGVTEALMLAHGFRVELLVDLSIAGLATAKPEHMRAGRRTMEVVRMKITEAGWRALTGKGSQDQKARVYKPRMAPPRGSQKTSLFGTDSLQCSAPAIHDHYQFAQHPLWGKGKVELDASRRLS